MAGLFIAGTNTEVGKTHVAALIARELAGAGCRVGVYKPAASGCRRESAGLIAEDAELLWQAAGKPGEFARVCPQCFELPVAPPQAARAAGKEVDRDLLRSGLDYWRNLSEVVIVEGAGGLMSPLSWDDYNIDVAREFGYPLVIVSANELGTINATLQTVITAQTKAPDLPIAGVVLNQPTSRTDDSLATNAGEIARRCSVPLLGQVEFKAEEFATEVNWNDLAKAST